MRSSDECYVIDLCAHVLQQRAERQRRFVFLRGDPGKGGRCAMLPVDAYYEALNLAIEYRERQHTEPNLHFDKPDRLTCSGCDRGTQRKRYDELRRDILPKHGIRLIELDCGMFQYNGQKRLKRIRDLDEMVIREKLAEFLPRSSD
jgi:hypothetical protein